MCMLHEADCLTFLAEARKQCFVPLVEDKNANMRLLHLGEHSLSLADLLQY